MRFVLKLVVLSLEDFSGAAPSLWIWFYAIAETPEAALASRESLIGELQRALVDERFTSFFEEERDDGERTYPLILRHSSRHKRVFFSPPPAQTDSRISSTARLPATETAVRRD